MTPNELEVKEKDEVDAATDIVETENNVGLEEEVKHEAKRRKSSVYRPK